ncbi:unnamed protein product [Mytilus edulis]|uniref:Uncharacterized protein n=1 Tax=Mytilus edulis TaxID=6550 RepID=A0A8S3R7L0_MYTED|nr:unnamed protein product [Mytilus edulis]
MPYVIYDDARANDESKRLVAIVGLFYLTSVNGLSCLFCDRAVNITDCLTQKAACKDVDEQCFLDKTILPDLTSVFSAGCRSKQVDPQRAGATCGVCDRVSDPKDCSVDQECQPTEVCKVNTIFSGGVLKYELGCEKKTECDLFLKEYKATHNTAAGRRADHGDLNLCLPAVILLLQQRSMLSYQ